MREAIGVMIFTAVIATVFAAVILQAKHDIARSVLYPVDDTEVLSPVGTPDKLTPVEAEG